MKYSKSFTNLINASSENNQYVGLGNPNAKILFVGKEPAMPIGTTITHGSASYWIDNKANFKRYQPDNKIKDLRHTWQKYQKVYDQTLNKLQIPDTTKDKYEITFLENVFTTELSNLAAPTTNQAKQLDGFKTELENRKKHFWKSEFINNFQIVVITASDNKYIETYKGEVCELFKVDFHEQLNCGTSNKMWVHFSKGENPKLVIHTRQLTNGASNELLEKISDIIADFTKKNGIEIKEKSAIPTPITS